MRTPSRAPERAAVTPQRGFTLVELIVAMVIIGTCVAGVLAAFSASVRGSAEPMVSKQLVAIAEALLEEVQQASFTYCDPVDANAEKATSSAACATVPEKIGPEAGNARPFDNVNDYHGLNFNPILNPISDVAENPVPDLAAYSAAIAVAPAALSTLAAGVDVATSDALRIIVTVSGPGSQTFALEGYRARYAPNDLP